MYNILPPDYRFLNHVGKNIEAQKLENSEK